MLKQFNKGVDLDLDFTKRIEGYFINYWQDNKIYRVLYSEEDKEFFRIIPTSIQV